MRFWLPIAVVGFIACCIGIYYYFSEPYYSRLLQFKTSDLMNSFSPSDDLQDAAYLLNSDNGGGLYRGGKLSFADYVTDRSIVRDFVYEKSVEAKLRYSYALKGNELVVNDKVVAQVPIGSRGLFLSPDAAYVGVASPKKENVTQSPEHWELRLAEVSTGKVSIIEGFAAVFENNTGLIAFRGDGIVRIDLATNEQTILREEKIFVPHVSVVFDRENSRLAYSTIAGDVFVEELNTSLSPMLLPIGKFTSAPGSVALIGSGVYIVSENEHGGTSIVRFGLFDGTKNVVRELPPILQLEKILP